MLIHVTLPDVPVTVRVGAMDHRVPRYVATYVLHTVQRVLTHVGLHAVRVHLFAPLGVETQVTPGVHVIPHVPRHAGNAVCRSALITVLPRAVGVQRYAIHVLVSASVSAPCVVSIPVRCAPTSAVGGVIPSVTVTVLTTVTTAVLKPVADSVPRSYRLTLRPVSRKTVGVLTQRHRTGNLITVNSNVIRLRRVKNKISPEENKPWGVRVVPHWVVIVNLQSRKSL